jgi:glycolate oxidase FAD binding subunit
VVVGYEDNFDALKWQMKQLITELGGRHDISGAVGCGAEPLWQRLVAAGACPEHGLSFKAGVLPSQVADFCRHAQQQAPQVVLHAHAGNGVVLGHVAEVTREGAVALLQALRQRAGSTGGHVVVTRCPSAWQDAAFVWGPPRSDWAVMRAVKEKLDPQRLFNPNRFVDGL